MTEPLDPQEFVAGYLVEVDELLSRANAQILKLDKGSRSGIQEHRAARELFRCLHTIKGLSAMVEIEPVVVLAHAMESTLRRAEVKGATLPVAVIDLLLEGTRQIETRVHALAQKLRVLPAPDKLVSALTTALDDLSGDAPVPAPSMQIPWPELRDKLQVVEQQELQAAQAANKLVFRLDFAPSMTRAAQGHTITWARERVEAVADIIKVIPRTHAAQPEQPATLVFVILAATDSLEPALREALAGVFDELWCLSAPGPAEAVLPEDSVNEPDSNELILPQRGVIRVETKRLDAAFEKLSELIVTRNRLVREVAFLRAQGTQVTELQAIAYESGRQLRDLRAAIMRTRMVAVGEILEKVPLIVRGLCQTTGKQARVHIDAGSAELDKAVTDRLLPAVVHLVRNAIDHGIEPATRRRALGKPEQGCITLQCSTYSDSQLELRVHDDGAGVDAARVAQRAGREIPAHDAALLDLLCLPGLSTTDRATRTSGRGMGMDIVRLAVHELGGQLTMQTWPQKGTQFTLRIPLTITIVDAFSFAYAGQTFAVPVMMVNEIIELGQQPMIRVPRGEFGSTRMEGRLLQHRGQSLPFFLLGALLMHETPDAAHKAIIVARHDADFAVGIDRMLGQQEIVVRPLNDPLVKVTGVIGATDLGDGQATLVLDLAAMMGARQCQALRSGEHP